MHDDMVRLQVPFSKSLNLGLSIQDLVLVFSLRPGPLKLFLGSVMFRFGQVPWAPSPQHLSRSEKDKIQTTMDRRTPVKYLALIFLGHECGVGTSYMHKGRNSTVKGSTYIAEVICLQDLHSFKCALQGVKTEEKIIGRKNLYGQLF